MFGITSILDGVKSMGSGHVKEILTFSLSPILSIKVLDANTPLPSSLYMIAITSTFLYVFYFCFQFR